MTSQIILKQNKNIFITGITGTACGRLAIEILQSGYTLQALMRAESISGAQNRLKTVFSAYQADNLTQTVKPLLGDITQPQLGLKKNMPLDNIGLIIHGAACVEFSSKHSSKIYEVNVLGTKNILETATRLQVPLVYVSTAYIAGERKGLVLESECNLGQGFNNVYEQSKCEAEELVRTWTLKSGLPAIILRPSIIVGETNTGATVHFNGIYDFMRAFDRLGKTSEDKNLRIDGLETVTKNLIPVDFFARAAWHIISRGTPGCYHLSNPHPPTLGELRNIFSLLFAMPGLQLVASEELSKCPPSKFERICHKAISAYAPYLKQEPEFDRKHTELALTDLPLPLPQMDKVFFQRLLLFARSHKWQDVIAIAGKTTTQIFMAKRYFTEFLADKVGKPLIPELKELSAGFRIIISDCQNAFWFLQINKGILQEITTEEKKAKCSFHLSVDTFLSIVRAKASPQSMFFTGKIKIKGDISTGLKLATVLEHFFKQYPFN